MCEPTGASNYAYGRREMGAKVERTGKKGEPLSNEKKNGGEKSPKPKDSIYFNKIRWWWYNMGMS